jgi:GntR family transcriptional regulator
VLATLKSRGAATKVTWVDMGQAMSTSALLLLRSFSDDMRRLGRSPETRVLAALEEPVPATVASALRLDLDETVTRIERLRLADGQPVGFEVCWFPQSRVPDLRAQDLRGSLYRILAEVYASPPDAEEQLFDSAPADDRLADLLEVPVGASLLAFRRTASSSGLPVEHTVSWFRPDRYSVKLSPGAR